MKAHMKRQKVECGPGISEEFREDADLRQGSALSPLLFIAVVEVISRKASTRDILRKLLYADDLAEQLVVWKEIVGKHGLRVNLEKTEVLWVGQQKKDLDVRLDRKKLNQRDSFVERFAGTAELRWKFAGEYKLGRARGGKSMG